MGVDSPLDLEWLAAPPPAAISRAEDLLARLGADHSRARKMARYPLHPRLARLVIDSLERGAAKRVAGPLRRSVQARERHPAI